MGYGLPPFTSCEMEVTGITSPALYLPSVLPSRDTETLIGLPRPIHESVKTLKQVRHRAVRSVRVKQPRKPWGAASWSSLTPCYLCICRCSEEGSHPWGSHRGGEIFGQDHQGPRGTAGHQVSRALTSCHSTRKELQVTHVCSQRTVNDSCTFSPLLLFS